MTRSGPRQDNASLGSFGNECQRTPQSQLACSGVQIKLVFVLERRAVVFWEEESVDRHTNISGCVRKRFGMRQQRIGVAGRNEHRRHLLSDIANYRELLGHRRSPQLLGTKIGPVDSLAVHTHLEAVWIVDPAMKQKTTER